MLTQRTWVHSDGQRHSIFLVPHHFELQVWPSTYLVCLGLRITRAASGTLTSDPDNKRNLQLQPKTCHVFSARIWPFSNLLRRPFPRLFPFVLQFDLWKTFFTDISTRHFPFLLEFDLWTAYFAEPPRAFFSSGDYSTALSDDFAESTQFDLRETSSQPTRFLCRFVFVRSLQSFPDIVLWERIVSVSV